MPTPTPLEVKCDELAAWIKANTGTPADEREALTQAGILLGRHCDAARTAELVEIKTMQTAARAASGKAPLVPVAVDAVAAEAKP